MKLWSHIRCFFYFINIDSPRMWKFLFLHGPRIQIFRNRRYPKHWPGSEAGKRMYIHYRWGGQILGLTIGDRGNSKEYFRRKHGLLPEIRT